MSQHYNEKIKKKLKVLQEERNSRGKPEKFMDLLIRHRQGLVGSVKALQENYEAHTDLIG